MIYRIASLTFDSSDPLPSFGPFACGESGADADVRLQRTQETPPEGKDLFSGDVAHRKVPGGWFFHYPGIDRTGLLVSDDYTDLRLIGHDPDRVSEMEEWYIRLALECRLIHMGYVSVHAAAVSLNGEAYAFTGPSGLGKSTRAGAWCDALGAELVSGDRPLIHAGSLELYGVPWDGKEQCHKNVHYPLKALMDIRRCGSDYLREMSFDQRRRLLMRQSFLPMWDNATAAVQMMNIVKLAKSAPLMRAFGGPSGKDAEALYEAVGNHIMKGEKKELRAKSGFILRNIVGEYMLMPVDDNIGKFDGTVLFNDVSAFIWEKLQNPVSREDLLTAVLEEFDVDEATAAADLDMILKKLDEIGILEAE